MRSRLARLLHTAGRLLDGTEGLHQLVVGSMNRYIGQTERYILDLEAEVDPHTLARLRKKHERFDTKPMRDAGAWN